MSLVDRETGELAEPEVIADRAEHYLLLVSEDEELALQRTALRHEIEKVRSELLEVLPPGGVIETTSGKVIRITGNRPAQRVNPAACQRFSEELEDLGLGERRFAPAGVALFRANQARIRGAGLPYDELVPEPPEPPDSLAVEPR